VQHFYFILTMLAVYFFWRVMCCLWGCIIYTNCILQCISWRKIHIHYNIMAKLSR